MKHSQKAGGIAVFAYILFIAWLIYIAGHILQKWEMLPIFTGG